MTDSEVTNNFDVVLETIRKGAEIIVEQNPTSRRPDLFPYFQGQVALRCVAIAEARGSTVTLDEGFMNDVEKGIADRSQPWKPPIWE